jgi:hypothetical protein
MARNSRTTSGASPPKEQWEPKVDKNPFYRTTDILNGVFKKRIKLDKGPFNSTDLSTIWVNFSEKRLSPIKTKDGLIEDKYQYTLECYHKWESKNDFEVGHFIPCWTCGSEGAYLGFEHEWEHIYFKSNLIARALFVDQYVAVLKTQAPHINEQETKNFLHLFINAFDDLRVNSLQEKVYPGSASRIWERWRNLMLERRDYDQNFLGFVMAIGLGMPVNPQGPYIALKPIVEWGTQKAKYRGFQTMLLDVRVVIERCMAALIQPPPPPPPPQPPQPSAPEPDDDQSDTGDVGDQGGGAGDSKPDDRGDQQQDQDGPDDGGAQPGQADPQASPAPVPAPALPPAGPTLSQIQASPDQASTAIDKLTQNARPLDPKEDHPVPTPDQIRSDPSSSANRAMVANVIGQDLADIDAVDAQMPDEPDQDMQQVIHTLQNSLPQRQGDSQLTEDARAKILLIDVSPHNIDSSSYVTLSPEEKAVVNHLRTVFYREMGRQKSSRDLVGPMVDIQAFINFRSDRKDPSVFENSEVNQGFAYHVLSDMSGSMAGIFPLVAHTKEMLKQSLDFPFVSGALWGFRGEDVRVDPMTHKPDGMTGEVWLFRYDKDCRGYEGAAPAWGSGGGKRMIKVRCGGITPMNSALRVTHLHMTRNIPAGMAKRLYLLTDGAPFQLRTTGNVIPEWLLRQFVAKEIREARSRGIEVYTIIIGRDIPDDSALQMFGPPKFWVRASGLPGQEDSVDKVLAKLVLSNFSKYLKQ